jgi:hypothetical protein
MTVREIARLLAVVVWLMVGLMFRLARHLYRRRVRREYYRLFPPAGWRRHAYR